jgi:hypothetical protein
VTNAEQRHRYRNDPEYRARILRNAEKAQRKLRQNPTYRRLMQVRRDIYRIRESYEARRAHAERLFARLEALIAEGERLRKQYHATKKGARRG